MSISYQQKIIEKKEIYDKIQKYCIEELRVWRAANSVTLAVNILHELQLHHDNFRDIQIQITTNDQIVIKNDYYDYYLEHNKRKCYVFLLSALKNVKKLCLKELESFNGVFSVQIALQILDWLGISDEESEIV